MSWAAVVMVAVKTVLVTRLAAGVNVATAPEQPWFRVRESRRACNRKRIRGKRRAVHRLVEGRAEHLGLRYARGCIHRAVIRPKQGSRCESPRSGGQPGAAGLSPGGDRGSRRCSSQIGTGVNVATPREYARPQYSNSARPRNVKVAASIVPGLIASLKVALST